MNQAKQWGRTQPNVAETIPIRPILISLALLPVAQAIASWNVAQQAASARGLAAFYHLPVIAVEVSVIALAVRTRCNPIRLIGRWPRWMQAALIAIVVIAAGTTLFVAPKPWGAATHSILAAIHLLFGLCLFDVMAGSQRPPGSDSRFWAWMTGGVLGYVGVLALFVWSIPNPDTFNWGRLGLGVVNVRQTGFYTIVGACAALGLAGTARSLFGYWAAVAAASIIFGVIVWSGSRGPILAVAAAVGGAAIVLRVRTFRLIAALLLSFASGILLSFVHHPPSPLYGLDRILGTAAATSMDRLSSGRIEILIGTAREIGQRPLFGYGADQFRALVPEAMNMFNSPHNAVLQVAFQWGLVGASCVFALFGIVWFRFMRAARSAGDVQLPAFLVANGLLVFSLYDVVAYYAFPMLMIGVGMILAMTANGPDRS